METKRKNPKTAMPGRLLSTEPLSENLQKRIGFWVVVFVLGCVLVLAAFNFYAASSAPEQAAVMAQQELQKPENVRAIAKAANPAQVAEPYYAFAAVTGEDAALWDEICEIKGALGMRLPAQCVPVASYEPE